MILSVNESISLQCTDATSATQTTKEMIKHAFAVILYILTAVQIEVALCINAVMQSSD